MNTVMFYVGSRYTLFVSYLVKIIYHKSDRCVLLLSDLMDDWRELREKIISMGVWDDIITIHERTNDINLIKEQAKQLSERDDVFCVYIPLILRKFTHIYSNLVNEQVKFVLLEEGNITPIIKKEYQNFISKSMDEGCPDFNFDRIDEVLVFVPEVCDPVGDAVISRICIEEFFSNDLSNNLAKLNVLFGYEFEEMKNKVVLVDNNYSDSTIVPKEYEYWCAKQMIDGINDVVIKLKPSNSSAYNLAKWGENIQFSVNSNNVFEVLFLNWYIEDNMPKCIVAYPSSTVVNIILFAKVLNIEMPTIVDINTIFKKFIRGGFWETHNLVWERYQEYYKEDKCKWYSPEDWEEYFILLKQLGKCEKDKTDYQILKNECEWFKDKYYFYVVEGQTNADSKVHKFKNYYHTMVKLLDNVLNKKGYKIYFEKRKWFRIGLFGAGIISKEFQRILSMEKIDVVACIVSSKDSQRSDSKIIYQYDEIETLYLDVIIMTIPYVEEIVMKNMSKNVRDIVKIEEVISQ